MASNPASSASAAAPIPPKAWSVLAVSTLAFTVCFMVWMMFGVIGIPLKMTLGLSATEFGLLTATPVLTGSLIRVPLGIWTDRDGGRIVMALLMAATVPAIWLMAYATAYWHFLVIAGPARLCRRAAGLAGAAHGLERRGTARHGRGRPAGPPLRRPHSPCCRATSALPWWPRPATPTRPSAAPPPTSPT